MKRVRILFPRAFLAVFFCRPLASITMRELPPQGVIDPLASGKIVGSEFYHQTL